jgi:hypothetical protein
VFDRVEEQLLLWRIQVNQLTISLTHMWPREYLPRGMMAIKLVTKMAVSEIESFPPALTKCSAQPIGTNTNKTFLTSAPTPTRNSSGPDGDSQPTGKSSSLETTHQSRSLPNLSLWSQQPSSHPSHHLRNGPIRPSRFTRILPRLGMGSGSRYGSHTIVFGRVFV